MVDQLQKVGVLPAERRSCSRYPFSASTEALDIHGTSINGRISDVSRNGCYVDTITPFALNTNITLIITKDNATFTTQATVVYSQAGMGMGIVFTAAEPDVSSSPKLR